MRSHYYDKNPMIIVAEVDGKMKLIKKWRVFDQDCFDDILADWTDFNNAMDVLEMIP